jgi:hypothetical protein
MALPPAAGIMAGGGTSSSMVVALSLCPLDPLHGVAIFESQIEFDKLQEHVELVRTTTQFVQVQHAGKFFVPRIVLLPHDTGKSLL